jgi:hypothetical protein
MSFIRRSPTETIPLSAVNIDLPLSSCVNGSFLLTCLELSYMGRAFTIATTPTT